jgi:hypothetical protein
MFRVFALISSFRRALHLGKIHLEKGHGLLTLRALAVPGKQVMEVRAIQLTLSRFLPKCF